MIDLRTCLASIRSAVEQGTPTNTELDGYYVVLRDRNGEMVDKQHFSRVAEYIYGYIVGSKAYEFAKIILNTEQNGTD